MKIELHLLQNVAPSCLNRDDTNTPKDCEFGGHRRARISSQCLKRAIRTDPLFKETFQDGVGIRTKHLASELAKRLAKQGKDEAEARAIVAGFINATKLSGLDKDGKKTKTLLHLGNEEVNRMEALLLDAYPVLLEAKRQSDEAKAKAKGKKKKAEEREEDVATAINTAARTSGEDEGGQEEGSNEKEDKKDPFKIACEQAVKSFKTGTQAVDIALFGRMMASSPDDGVDAACQVAHAISTNKVSMEMDYYTAVDDLPSDEETGAAMIGFTGFNSSCFYRYAVIDFEQLKKNLDGDEKLAYKAIETFIRSSVAALPTGKQNSMAAHNPPDAILAVVRQSGAPVSLANAFSKPVRPYNTDLMTESIKAMDEYWGKLAAVYGKEGVTVKAICVVPDVELNTLKDYKKTSFNDVVTAVMTVLQGSSSGGNT